MSSGSKQDKQIASPNFDSPNITSAADEVMEMIDVEAEARKKAETVDIDGIPIDEKDLRFKAEDIKKKGKTEYFVNVEGAEQRKREAQRRAKLEAEEAERRAKLEAEEAKRRAKADDDRVINELHKKAEQRKRENRAAEEKAKAEDNRVIGELHKKAVKRKKENRTAKRQKFFQKNKKLFKIILIVIVALLIIAGIATAVYFILNPPPTEEEKSRREEGAFLEQTVRDFNEVYEYYDNHPEDTGSAYAEACKIADEILANANDNKTKYAYVLQYTSFVNFAAKDYYRIIDLINENIDVAETDEQKYHFYSTLEGAYIKTEQYEEADKYQKLMEGLDVNYDEEEQ